MSPLAAPLLSRSIHSSSSAHAAADPPPRVPPRPISGATPSASSKRSKNRKWVADPTPPQSQRREPVDPPPAPASRAPGRLVRAWRRLPRWMRVALVLYNLVSAITVGDSLVHLSRVAKVSERADRDAMWDAYIARGYLGVFPWPQLTVDCIRWAQSLLESVMDEVQKKRQEGGK